MKKYLGGLALLAIVATCCLVGNSEGQSAGGFPSQPTFQKVTIAGTGGNPITATAAITGGGTQTMTVGNTSTVGGDGARYIVSAGSSQIQIGACNQNQSTLCKTVNGPSAPGGYIETFGAIPLVFGTANTYAGQINATQQLSMGAGSTATARNLLVINPTAGTTAAAQFSVQNDLQSTAHEVELGYTSSTFSGAFMLNGATGESAYLETPANLPLCIGTNGKCVIAIDGATQQITLPQSDISVAGTLSNGCTTTPAQTLHFHIVGKVIVVSFPNGGSATCTSNVAGSFTVTVAFPAAAVPAANTSVIGVCENNGALVVCNITPNGSGASIFFQPVTGTFSGVTGPIPSSFTYTTD